MTPAERVGAPELSLVAPVLDEEGNLRELYDEIVAALGERRWELVLVDDGSRDGSAAIIRELAASDPRVRGALLARRCGQSAATAVGIRMARGALVATLDADRQNDPADLPGMIDALGDHDAVVGYRVTREDDWLRRVSSRIANALRNRVSGDSIRDTGCSLKLFRAAALEPIPWFDGAHRFLPTLLRYHGFRVLEHPVSHRPRVAGETAYGIANRAWRGLVDLAGVRWLRARALRPEVREEVGSGAGGDG